MNERRWSPPVHRHVNHFVRHNGHRPALLHAGEGTGEGSASKPCAAYIVVESRVIALQIEARLLVLNGRFGVLVISMYRTMCRSLIVTNSGFDDNVRDGLGYGFGHNACREKCGENNGGELHDRWSFGWNGLAEYASLAEDFSENRKGLIVLALTLGKAYTYGEQSGSLFRLTVSSVCAIKWIFGVFTNEELLIICVIVWLIVCTDSSCQDSISQMSHVL